MEPRHVAARLTLTCRDHQQLWVRAQGDRAACRRGGGRAWGSVAVGRGCIAPAGRLEWARACPANRASHGRADPAGRHDFMSLVLRFLHAVSALLMIGNVILGYAAAYGYVGLERHIPY